MNESDVDGARVIRRAGLRIIPLLGLAYLVAFMDRSNIAFAAKTMNADLGFSATVYGIGGAVFFLSYALFEIPSNILLERVGARRWIARIMITWGLIAAAMMVVRNAWAFYAMRFLLGLAEAGFFPGVVFYLSLWFPRAERGRAISRFYISGPLARVVMGIVSVWLLSLNGFGGLRGWQWLFLAEGLPAVVVGLLVLWLLPDRPERVTWLSDAEKGWLARRLAEDAPSARRGGLLAALRLPVVLLLGLIGGLTTMAYYTFTLSEPQILREATGWSVASIGYLVSAGGLAGAGGMLLTGALSDRIGTRIPFLAIGAALVLIGYGAFWTRAGPVVALGGYLCYVLAWGSVTLSVWMLCTDLVNPRDMAVATAAVNTMSQAGAFVGPILWGLARDATGAFGRGFAGLVLAQALALGMIAVLHRLAARNKGVA